MPLPELRTDRLILRPVTADDVDTLHAMWTAPDMRRYLWDDVVIPREIASEVVESHVSELEPRGIGFWLIQFEGAAAGFCGFRSIDHGTEIEILYGLDSRYWGKGFATEASRAALDYLWSSTKFDRVFGRTDPPNIASIALLRTLGMSHVSTTGPMTTYVLTRPRSTPGDRDGLTVL